MPVAGALIVGGLGLAGSAIASNNAKKASNAATAASTQANNANNALQQGIYNQNAATLAPFVQQGQSVNPQVNALLSGNPYKTTTGATFEADPRYQFALSQGLRGVAGQFADRMNSGGFAKALQDRGAGIANQFYSQWRNDDQQNLANYNNAQSGYLNALTGQQGMGLQAAGAQAGVGLNYANNVSNNNWQNANNTGNAALLNSSNQNALLNGAFGSIGNAFSQSGFGSGSSYGQPPNAPPLTGWQAPSGGGYMPSMY